MKIIESEKMRKRTVLLDPGYLQALADIEKKNKSKVTVWLEEQIICVDKGQIYNEVVLRLREKVRDVKKGETF